MTTPRPTPQVAMVATLAHFRGEARRRRLGRSERRVVKVVREAMRCRR